jgi:hypothetical protein
MPYYHSHGDAMFESLGTLWSIFCAMAADNTLLDGLYLVIDALDECEESSRDNLLKCFRGYFESRSGESKPFDIPFLKAVVTGRPYTNLERLLHGQAFFIRLKTEENEGHINEDISSFISHEIDKIGHSYTDGLRKDIHRSLVSRQMECSFGRH